MKKTILANLVVLLVSAVGATAVVHKVPGQAGVNEYAPNEIIVKFRETAAAAVAKQLELDRSAGELTLSRDLDELNARYAVGAIKPLFKNFNKHRQRLKALLKKDEGLLTKKEQHILRRLRRAPKAAKVPDLNRIYKIEVELEPGQSLEEVVAAYNGDPDVEYAELNYIVSIDLTPNDPLYPIQWPLHNTGQMYPASGRYNLPPGTPDSDIDAPEAWDIETGSWEVIVAVVDTGVDYAHRDLQANMWVNDAEFEGDEGVDDDDNGYIDDIYGYDFRNNDSDPKDDNGHGTHCSGTIAARGDNGLDIVGVCWNARIMAVKFLGSNGKGKTDDAVTAFYYAVDNGADVISNSWGGGNYLETAEQAINYAYSQGVIMAASAGNSNTDAPHYPAYYEHMVSVAATDSDDQKASFSNYGDWVDIAAPGVDVLSLLATDCSKGTPYDPYTTILSGTSMACPHVSGGCGLLLSLDPFLGYDEICQKLAQTVDPIGPAICQSGRLNLASALAGVHGLHLDKDLYSCSDQILIHLVDSNLAGEESYTVNLETTGGDLENVELEEISPPEVGVFTGTISTDSGSPDLEDGTLQLSHGGTITVTYESGMDTALADCEPPEISNVQIGFPGREPRIFFETNEPTTARVFCGHACGGPYIIDATDDQWGTSHTIILTPVSPATDYFFIIEAADIVGNVTVDDNAGPCYVFTTFGPTDIYVPAHCSTIQEAIDNCWSGRTVWAADGTYTGQGNRDLDFKGSSITVRSENGPENCIVDCQNQGRGFYFHNAEDGDSVLDGFTITNGLAAIGGGICCEQSSPMIINCIIIGNSATDREGGGISCDHSSPTISNCTISENSAHFGGGIFVQDSNLTIDGCAITANQGDGGGGMECRGSNLTIANCTIADNETEGGGGGIHCYESDVNVTNCTISRNTAAGAGGIWVRSSVLELRNCVLFDNYATWYGGGIEREVYSGEVCIVTLINCTLVGNTAGANGGGLDGGGTARNCIFWSNSSSQITGGASVTYSDVQGGYSGQGNINANPLFIDAPNGDHHLTTDSPCINAGDPYYSPAPAETDIDGEPRVMLGRVDMGSDEVSIEIAFIEISSLEFDFCGHEGGSGPESQILSIRNGGVGTLTWNVAENCPWLAVNPLNGESTGEYDDVVLSVGIAGLSPGRYSCFLTILAPEAFNSPVTVHVNLTVASVLWVPTQEYPTIQAGIDAAIGGDVVLVADGTYTGQGNRDIDFNGKPVTVRSENGPANCIIDCEGNAAEPHRGFYFRSGETALSMVEGFTITNGYAIFGAGIQNDSSSPTVTDCVFRQNIAEWYGGGMENYQSSPTVRNCIFTENAAIDWGYGGGVDNLDSSPVIINCTFYGNSADYGGGISNSSGSSPNVTNCILWGDAASDGPEIYGNASVSYSAVHGGFSGEGNIDANPLFVDAAEDDYHLSPGSPAIDVGDPASNWTNEPWPNGGRVNIGAYGNTREATRSGGDFEDLARLADYWLDYEPYVDTAPEPDGDGIVNFLDFAVLAENWVGGVW